MSVNFKEISSMSFPSNDYDGEYKNRKFIHICEVCGKREILTPREGYENGWNYAPYCYHFKVISPRTCGKCGIEKTAYWAIAAKNKAFDELTASQKETIKRIYNEPESILAKE